MCRISFVLIFIFISFKTYSQVRWVFLNKAFSVTFPEEYKDTSYRVNDEWVYRASAVDNLGNQFVAECHVLSSSIFDNQYKANWKIHHDKVLSAFLKVNQLEKTEEKRFDIGNYHGIQAILNHKTQRLTFFYKNIIIGNKSITLYVIQSRTALDFKVVKKFFQSASYQISLLLK